MSEQIQKSFKELVELKFQLYNSLFLTLPLDAVEQTGLLLPLLQEACSKGFENGKSPEDIINSFFMEHKSGFNEKDRITFLFKVIQYVERQIVLIDALEEAAYGKIHNVNDSNRWEQIYAKVKNRNIETQLEQLLQSFGLRVVLTAHPTQFYPGNVLAISNDLTEAIEKGDIAFVRDLLQQLGKTAFYRKKKPTAFDEATALTWYLGNVFYPAVGELMDRLVQTFAFDFSRHNALLSLGFWPGGDRDGNPFVTVNTTRKVAKNLRNTLTTCYLQDVKQLKRRLSFDGVYGILTDLDHILEAELTHINGEKNVDLSYFLNRINEIEVLLVDKHQSLFLDKLQSFRRKVQLFGFHFASIDIRQDSRIIKRTFDAVLKEFPTILPENFDVLELQEQLELLLKIEEPIEFTVFDDDVIQDTCESFGVISEIQAMNGEAGAHRYIISNCRGVLDIGRVIALARLCSFGKQKLSLDIIPLFETVDDLHKAGKTMNVLYTNGIYMQHLAQRNNKQTVMLGFSDGTKDGGYLMANWSIYRAKEDITKVSRNNTIEVQFFDGRGGPPARGGGDAHKFYAAMGKEIESKQIQITVQGQTISSHYGIKEAAVHNLGHLLSAGIENNLFNRSATNLNKDQRKLIDELSENSFAKYEALKKHELFIPFLEERSTLKYYGMANIGSRPSKRGANTKLRFEDLRAIPFVGAWSQLKQNVPGFFGVGTALKEQAEKGNLQACSDLYHSSIFFKTLISNSMQSMSKTNFSITRYMEQDEKFGGFWNIIHDEYLLSKEMVLKISGLNELLEDNPRSRMSINLREKVVLPLLAIQQYALIEIQKAQQNGNDTFLEKYERMVMRSLFGNINASRNSV
ncbi:MAG: phosphoenolpyruvate carboxylase [Salinivirgaceae bacterium]|jgi:phosphoenolpyruvate carboxylase|nr:phosphoenolpyruvate carboxylase [Salinivirgaceae bacterium]